MKVNKETIKTVINIICTILSAIAGGICIESCSNKVPLLELLNYAS